MYMIKMLDISGYKNEDPKKHMIDLLGEKDKIKRKISLCAMKTNIIYRDTDSVMFVCKKSQYNKQDS
jgi:hypothetical protein